MYLVQPAEVGRLHEVTTEGGRMAEADRVAALERELSFYVAAGNTDRARQVRAELGIVETAVDDTPQEQAVPARRGRPPKNP